MGFTQYKVTIVRSATFMWLIEVWQRDPTGEETYGPWRSVARHSAYNMEGHADVKTRLRVALRGLVA